ncbi:MAG: dipeptidyl aminopeptidase/acylaminoacyl peptidase [Candidatus Latescibacterota bacterium]
MRRKMDRRWMWLWVASILLALGAQKADAQDILTTQLQQGFGKNKVRYKDFQWEVLESEHLELHFEAEFHGLAVRAVGYLEEGYDHISEILHHELSHHPPIVIYQSHYEFQQTNIIHEFLPPGVAGFAEPLRYRMVIPFNGDLDEFRNVLVHELTHIFQYDIVYKGPIKRISNQLSAPPTWIMEGLAEYTTPGRNTIDEMVLRDAVLTDGLIPLETMNAYWGSGNVFLGYKQSHSIMEFIAANYGPEKISRILRLWDSQKDTDKLLERLIDMDMQTLDERWSAHMRKQYWPLLQTRDYISEIADKIGDDDDIYQRFASPRWSLSGDMLAVLSSDGIEQHVDIIRLKDASLVERITRSMRTSNFDHLTSGHGTVAWAPDGHTIAFVAKDGPRDRILLWDLYDKALIKTLRVPDIETVESLAWAPNSHHLALVGTGYGQSDLYILDVKNDALRQLTGTPQREDHPAFSPDGRHIAYSSKQQSQFDIKVYDLEKGESETVISSPTDDLWPQWLPEGNKILFVSTRDKINDLFVYHLEEQREYRLTRTLSGIMNPALSPDGRQIVFNTYFKGRSEIYLMDMPDWPALKRLDTELLARAGEDKPKLATQSAATDSSTNDSTAGRIVAAAATTLDTAHAQVVVRETTPLTDQGGRPDLSQVSQLKERALSSSAVLLANTASAAATAPAPEDDPALQLPIAELSAELSDAAIDIDIEGGDAAPLGRRRYTPKLEFDGISVQMGYFDGFFSSIAQLSMSDLLGNHSLSLATDYVASQEISNDFNFAMSYEYYGKRPTYRMSVFNWNQYFNNNRTFIYRGTLVSGISRVQQRGMLADASYPLDLYRRLDFNYTYVGEQEELIWPLQEIGATTSTHLVKSAYVHDSITYGLLGPTAGKRYFLSVGRTLDFGGATRSFSHVELDYRTYVRLGRWSVLGLRGYGVGSLGNDALSYNLGGPTWFLPFYTGFNLNTGPLRGYEFSEFTGSRVLLANAELRVPFVRGILFGWPSTFLIPAIDGSLFFDIGTAWNEDDKLDLWPFFNPDADPVQQQLAAERRLQAGLRPVNPLRASVGFGLLVYFVLPMNFEFAKQTDLQGHYSDYQFHFSFGKSF